MMKENSFKGNRKALMALLLCAGFIATQPIKAVAEPAAPSTWEAQQQKQTITGTVTDQTGEGVIGASILEKGTTNGTITDIDGNFSLSVEAGATLVISYIGYKSQEVVATPGKTMNIKLEEDSEMLEEVVVVGYGTTKRKNFTGSVSTVKAAESPLALMPTSNAMDILRGTATGITVSQQQGAGQSPSLLVRGQKSVNGGTDPLIVMDGVIYMGSFRDIDPASIESMSVLKDATSLAAYGSQAANGVIMITTKKGKMGKPVITFNTSWALSTATCKPDVLSPEDYVKKVNLLNGLDEGADPTWMQDFEYENYQNGKTIDWWDYSTRTGLMQNYSASVSGANEKINYYLSATYTDQAGIVEGDDYDRIVLNSRLQSDITDWLQVGGQMNYAFNDYSGPSTYDLYQAIRLSPYGRAEREDGGGLEKYPVNEGIYRINPLWSVKSGTIDDHDTYATTTLKGHLLLKCPWIEGLTFRMNGSYAVENIERDYFTHEGYYIQEGSSLDRYSASTINNYLASANGYSARTKNTSWVWDNILNYTRQFGKHFIDLTYVYTRDSDEYYYRRFDGSDFSALGNTNLGYDGLNYAATQEISSLSYTLHTDVGYLGRINYNYDDTYHISVSVRRDGSSVFGANNKWGTFPAIGLAWTVTNEEFMKKVPVINYLKVKASWGINGNQSLDPYETLSKITLGQAGGYSYTFGNTSEVSWGQRITSMGNSDLGWEETESFNYGFDLGLLDDRIHLEFDGYFSKTTNQIFSRTIPVMINGLTSMSATMGQVNNWGIEFNLTTTNIQTKDFTWNSGLTFYMNRNKLKELYGDGQDDITNSLFLGKSLGAIYGYKPIGIVQEDDTEYIAANSAEPGDVKFANLDGSTDGVISADDRTILGYNKENFRMSFSNTFRYKDFELYVLFTGLFGGNGYGRYTNIYAYRTASDVAGDNNFNHGWWTAENRSNKYPRINYTDSRYAPVQGYGFVRLQDLSLAYTFRQPWVKKMNISNLKVYLACKNLFTLTGWDGGDPEVRQTLGSGYSYGYPLSRTVSLGLNLTF
ncbi:MAG: TonB-dependent receptor [Bacteroides sp.]|nr:TonB-dependent receptor [Bacteroides sp.]